MKAKMANEMIGKERVNKMTPHERTALRLAIILDSAAGPYPDDANLPYFTVEYATIALDRYQKWLNEGPLTFEATRVAVRDALAVLKGER